jgi:hypothetical protein
MRTAIRIMLAILGLVGVAYCLAGATMASSFSVSAGAEHLSRYRAYVGAWLAGAVGFFVLCASQLVFLWRDSRRNHNVV